jgi:hypothetical protein
MRLSDAIAMGRTLVTPKPGAQFNIDENAGCALGMAINAAGGVYMKCPPEEHIGRTGKVDEWWSFLGMGAKRPCDCYFSKFPHRMPKIMAGKEIVAHLFDRHVFGKCDWTLDQLIDWVRSVEPAEPELQQEPVAEQCAPAPAPR